MPRGCGIGRCSRTCTTKRRFARTHIFPGEDTEVTWTISNDKPLPISWLRWQEPIPLQPTGVRGHDGLELDGPTLRPLSRDVMGLDEITSLRDSETMTRTCQVHGLRRGDYRFGPAKWTASDALGLFEAEGGAQDSSSLTIYPAIRSSSQLDIAVRALLGDIKRRHSLVEDPTWYRGGREYQTKDPMRFVDWRATARGTGLKVKMFDPTVHPKLMILDQPACLRKDRTGLGDGIHGRCDQCRGFSGGMGSGVGF